MLTFTLCNAYFSPILIANSRSFNLTLTLISLVRFRLLSTLTHLSSQNVSSSAGFLCYIALCSHSAPLSLRAIALLYRLLSIELEISLLSLSLWAVWKVFYFGKCMYDVWVGECVCVRKCLNSTKQYWKGSQNMVNEMRYMYVYGRAQN